MSHFGANYISVVTAIKAVAAKRHRLFTIKIVPTYKYEYIF